MKGLLVVLVLVAAVTAYMTPEQIIQIVNTNPKSTWRAGYTKFNSNEELQALLGSSTGMPKDLQVDESPVVGDLPASYDFYQAHPECKFKILDQGQCGSCWAFGVAESFSHRWCQKKGQNVVLSPQELVSCDIEGNQGCNGGIPHLAWDYCEALGIPTLTCEPYVSGDGNSRICLYHNKCTNKSEKVFTRYKVKLFSTKGYKGEEAMKKAIYEDGPITGTFQVYEDFKQYKSGVYQHVTGSYLGGHAVLIRGWGVENNIPYWVIDNSWGPSWGEAGSFRIIRGKDDCQIEDGSCAGLPK